MIRKTTIISAMLLGTLGAYAQKPAATAVLGVPGALPVSASASPVLNADVAPAFNQVAAPVGNGTPSGSFSRRGSTNYAFVRIGVTKYDLQSNGSMSNRLRLFSDGTMMATWTQSNSTADGFPDRGAGLNYYNGTDWRSEPSSRIETVRTGWPSGGRLRDGREWVIAHDATGGGFTFSKNTGKGSTTWSGTKVLEQNPYKPIWSRAVNWGDTIHLICSYSDSSAAGDKRPWFKGVLAPVVYSRSKDGGTTWDKQHMMLPGVDSTNYYTMGGDQYSIDVRDSIVAIIFGDLTEHVTVWKSTNHGNSFTQIIVDSFDYAPFKGDKLIPDTPFVADGTVDVMIDKDGKLHAFWGLSRVLKTSLADAGYNFYPSTYGLSYWSEATDSVKIIATGGQLDRDGTAGLNLDPGTWQTLSSGNLPPKSTGGNYSHVARLGNTSVLRQPSAGTDDNGGIYVTFSLPMEEDVTQYGSNGNNIYESNYRDICIVNSQNNGATWQNPQNITQRLGMEDDFACVARKVNGFVHVIWQQDNIPGTNLQNNSTSAGNHPIPDEGNSIYYAAVPVGQIVNGEIGNQFATSVDQFNKNGEVMVVSQNQPNPFNGNTSVIVYLTDRSDVKLTVTNLAGQVVQQQEMGNMLRGTHMLNIDGSRLSSGVYFYTITAGSNSVTRKMNVN